MDEQTIFQEMVTILMAYTKDVSLLDKATRETHILKDLRSIPRDWWISSSSVKMFSM